MHKRLVETSNQAPMGPSSKHTFTRNFAPYPPSMLIATYENVLHYVSQTQ